jgi:hypothetical protein
LQLLWYVVDVSVAQKSYDEIVNLFARGGGAGVVLAFRPSEEAQARVRDLLARNAEGELSEDESAELERFGELERLMQLVKARARQFST